MIFEKCMDVCGCVCVCLCVCACVRVCVCIRLDLSSCSVDFNRRVLIFFVFLVWWRIKNPFFDWIYGFLFYFEFSIFSKFIFVFFLMIGPRYLNRIGSIRKSIKEPKFSKQNYFSSYHGSCVINKTVFCFQKLVTPKLNGQFFGAKSG